MEPGGEGGTGVPVAEGWLGTKGSLAGTGGVPVVGSGGLPGRVTTPGGAPGCFTGGLFTAPRVGLASSVSIAGCSKASGSTSRLERAPQPDINVASSTPWSCRVRTKYTDQSGATMWTMVE
jgi:hypothetical protein